MVPLASRPSTAGTPRPKNTLFCPDCGREEPADGDWQRRPRASGVALRCPTCGTDLTVRPSGTTDGRGVRHARSVRRAAALSAAVARSVRAGVALTLTAWSPTTRTGHDTRFEGR